MTTTELQTKFVFTKSGLNRAIDAHAGQKNVTLRDEHTSGLVLRQMQTGWFFGVYRKINGKVHRVSIGEYVTTTDLNQIRAEAEDIMRDIRRGEYIPAKVTAAKNQEATDKKAMTLGEALTLHLRVNPQLRNATAENYARGILWLMDLDAQRDSNGRANVIGTAQGVSIPIASLTTDRMRAAYDRLCDADKVSCGNSMLRSVRAIWNTWADETDFDGRNPVIKITAKRGRVKKVAPRTGAIEPGQRAGWYRAMEGQARNSATFSTARACQMLFLTGLRLNEVLGMRWADVDEDAQTISIPADRMKAGVALSRPITREVARILEAQKVMSNGTEWVFFASRGPGHVTDTRKTLAMAEPKIINHDLRRGFIVAGALALVPDVATKMLVGHSTSDITATYARAIASELPDIAQKIEDALLSEVAQ